MTLRVLFCPVILCLFEPSSTFLHFAMRSFILRLDRYGAADASVCSQTWTHNLDPMRPVCRYELHGICSDSQCPEEHLRTDPTSIAHQLMCITAIGDFFSGSASAKVLDKALTRAKLDVRSGKDAEASIQTLITFLSSECHGKLPLCEPTKR